MKAQIPILNHASGQSAGFIYQTYYGNTYMRSMPVLFHYPDTPAQQKAQGTFYNIQEQLLAIYGQYSLRFPGNQRHNTNMFDVISKGIYTAAKSYPNARAKSQIRCFGNDRQKQVKITPIKYGISIDSRQINVESVYAYSTWRRVFSPVTCYLLLINQNQQLLLATSFNYMAQNFTVQLTNSQVWVPNDEVVAYLALGNQEFFSNFNLISL